MDIKQRGPWIATRHGIAFELLEPTPGMIDWRDIAYALGHLCRWTGHTNRFYSVAEHSSRVAGLVIERLPGDRDAYLYALLHDAHEAYVGDLSAPLKWALKRVAKGANVAKLVAQSIDRAIFLAFGLPPTMPEHIAAAIHEADMVLLATELRDLMPASPEWEWQPPEPLATRIEATWEPARAVVGYTRDLILAQSWLPRGQMIDARSDALDVLEIMKQSAAAMADVDPSRDPFGHEAVLRAEHETLLAIVEPLLITDPKDLDLMRFNGLGGAADVIQKLQLSVIQVRAGETISDAAAAIEQQKQGAK